MKRLPFMEEVENNFSQRLCDKLVKKLKKRKYRSARII